MADLTVLWLVNGERVTVDGDIQQVVSSLDAGRRTFVELKRGEESVYVHPGHVTHFMNTSAWDGSARRG